MPYDINNPINTTYFVACHPFYNTYHDGTVKNSNCLSTGLPLMVYGLNQSSTYDLVFSEYEFKDDMLVNSIPREILWSVGYSFEDANNIITIVNNLLPNLFLQSIKHPNREEYALPWSDYIISTAPEGDAKDAIINAHNNSISENNVKTTVEMKSLLWF